jgi:hypothetical protein
MQDIRSVVPSQLIAESGSDLVVINFGKFLTLGLLYNSGPNKGVHVPVKGHPWLLLENLKKSSILVIISESIMPFSTWSL